MMTDHPFRPLFVEVPVESPKPRFGVLDMTSLGPLFRLLYVWPAPPITNDHAPEVACVSMIGPA
jgi:hypothetical protein